MKKKFLIASIFFFITGVIGNHPSSIALVKEDNKESKIDINLNYLENLPTNDYILGPGDKINVIVARDLPNLETTVTIDGEGTIYLPKLNRIYVSGLTLNELNLILNKAFKKFINFPSVEVSILNYRRIRVLVQGEVENPGVRILSGSFSVNSAPNKPFNTNSSTSIVSGTKDNIPIEKEVYYFPTVFDAIRTSGGITLFSDLTNIKVIRQTSISNGGGKIQTTLNFEEIITNGDAKQNIRIYDSDIIIVRKTENSDRTFLRRAVLSNLNPKFLNVFVTGRVNIPGKTVVSKASVLSDAIDIAGGAKVLKGPITFLRFNNDGNIDKRKIAFRKNAKRGSYKNPYLRSGDLIVVGESALTNLNEVLTEFTSPLVGIFSTYGLIKAISD